MPSPDQETIIAVSSMLGGVTNKTKELGIPREVIAFPWIKITDDPHIVGIHTALHPDLKATAAQLFYKHVPFTDTLFRLGTLVLMRSIEKNLEAASHINRDIYVLCHPDCAAYLYLRLESGQVFIPDNVIIAIENDSGLHQGFYLSKIFPGEAYDPCQPATVDVLATKFEAFGARTWRVLDVHHLHESLPDISISEAVSQIGGHVDILHLSGVDHNGYSLHEAVKFINQVKPRIAVLEGPVSRQFPLGITSEELSQLQNHVAQLRQEIK